jgi:hypothetical protein
LEVNNLLEFQKYFYRYLCLNGLLDAKLKRIQFNKKNPLFEYWNKIRLQLRLAENAPVTEFIKHV